MSDNPEILKVLAVYEAAGNERNHAEQAVDECRVTMEKLCKAERRWLSQRARAIVGKAREGWDYDSADVHVLVSHAHRPYRYNLMASVMAYFHAGSRRGHLRLSGLWTEREALLVELAATVGADGG